MKTMTSRAVISVAFLLSFGCGEKETGPGAKVARGGSNATGGASGSGGSAAEGGTGVGGSNGGTGGSAGASETGGASGRASGGKGGSAGRGGSSAGKGGSSGGGTGGSGPFVPPKCANDNKELPDDAPELELGVWTPLNPSQVTYGDHEVDVFTQGLALDPCNPATIYLTACANPVEATSNPGLYRTTNAGTTWERIGPFDGPIIVRVDPADPLHLYVGQGVRGDTMGFWVSKDGGETWVMPQGFKDTAAIINDSDVYHIATDPADFNHLLISFHYYWNGGDTMGVIESFDGGDSFIIHDPIPGLHGGGGFGVFFLYEPKLGIGDNKTWLLGTQGLGYFRTSDAGENWTKVTDNNMEHGGGQIYYTKEGVLFAGGNPNIMRSKDNGVTWELGGNPEKANWGYIGIVGDGTNLYTSGHDHVAEFQTSPESDGLVWRNYNQQLSNAGSFELAYDAANGIIYSANEYDGLMALKVR
jgi:hypothetical protein